MEGDAGTSRLNPNEIDDSSSSEVKAEDSAECEAGTDQTSTEVKAEDSAECEAGTDQTSTEATEEGLDHDAEDSSESELDTEAGTDDVSDGGNPSRMGRGWLVGIAAALVVLAGGVGAGGYLALKSDRE